MTPRDLTRCLHRVADWGGGPAQRQESEGSPVQNVESRGTAW